MVYKFTTASTLALELLGPVATEVMTTFLFESTTLDTPSPESLVK